MARLSRMAAVLLTALGAAVPAHAGEVERWAVPIAEASSRFGIPQAWIRRVIAAESGGRTRLNGRPVESHAGAMGLMQLMPGTWRAMRAAHGLGPDPHDPRDNIMAGTAYLRRMYDRFGYPGLFGAYNAGPGAYAAWLAGNRRLPAETRAYLAQVASVAVPVARGDSPTMSVRSTQARPAPMQPPPLFAIRAGAGADARSTGEAVPPAVTAPRASIFFPLDGRDR